MNPIHQKTLQDLEFETVLIQTAAFASTTLGTAATLAIVPHTNEVVLQ